MMPVDGEPGLVSSADSDEDEDEDDGDDAGGLDIAALLRKAYVMRGMSPCYTSPPSRC